MSKSLEDTLVPKQGGEGDEEEEDNKPKSAIIIPQKVMKSPLDVVNTYPSKFQNGTFKAHVLEESDNEESDTPTNGSGSARHSSYHKQSSSSSTSKQTHKKVEEARKAANQAKQELNLLKIKQDLMTLRTNELIAQMFHSMDASYNSIIQDDQLKENFAVLLQVYQIQKDEYHKLLFPSTTESSASKIPSAHESVLEAEYLVEKTLENFEEELEKSTENPLGLRLHASEITLKEKQLEHMQEQLDIDGKKSMSQSSLSDDYQSNPNQSVEDELASLKEQNQYLQISAENIKKQLNILQIREANYDLQDSQIQELRSILSKQDKDALSDKQAFEAKVAERLQLTQRLNKLEKKVKLLSTENAEIKNSLKVFSLENSKLEKMLEVEKKSTQQLLAFTDGDETKLVDGLNAQLETLKEQVSDLLREKDTLQQKVQISDKDIHCIKSNENSRELDTMEEDFDKQEEQKQDNWNMKMIQAKSMVLEERQNIEQEKKDIFERLAKISEEKLELQKQNENLLRDNSQSKICYKTVEKQFKEQNIKKREIYDAVKENDKLKKKQVEFEEKSKQLAELQEESENLQEQLKELEQLKKEKDSLIKEKQDQEKELADIKKSYAEIENQLISVKKLSSEMVIQSQQQQQQATQLQQISEKGEEVKVLNDPSRVSELQTELDEKIKMIQQVELQKQSYQNENATFKSTYKRLEKQLRKSIKEKESLRKELEHEKLLFAEKTTGGDQRVLEVLKKEIKTLTEERDELAKKNSKQDAKIKQLSQEANMKKMESEFDGEVGLQEKIEKAKSQVIEEKQLVEAEKLEIEKKLEDTVTEKNLLQIKSEAILSENQSFHSNLKSIQVQLKSAIKERDAVILERNSLKSELAEKDAEIEKNNIELSRLEEQISLKENLSDLQQPSTGGRNQDDEDDDDDMSHSMLIQQKDKIIAEKDQVIEDMGRVKQQLDARANIAERELQAKSKEVERQQNEIEELQKELQDNIAKLQQKSKELEGTENLDKLEEEFNQREKGSNADVEDKLKEIVQQKSRVELENAGTKENYKALEKEFRRSLKACDELRKKMAESEEKIKELEDENGQLQEKNEKLKQEQEQTLAQLNESKQSQPVEDKQQQSANEEGSSQISEDMRLMLADLKLENQALLIEQNIQKKTNDRLESELNQLKDELKMQDMDQEFEEETKQTASIIEEKDKVIDQLHKSTTAISQENTGLKSTFKSLEKELRRQVKECDEGKKAIKRLEGENQALAEQLAQYKEKYNITDVEGQESSDAGASGDKSVDQNISAFQELQAKYEGMVKEQEEFKLGLMLEFQEKEHQIEKTKSEIELEKNDLERKANSITQEQSQQKLFYASLEKQFRGIIKDSDALKKQVQILQKFKGKIEEIVKVIQQESNDNQAQQLQKDQVKDSGNDSEDTEDNVLQYDIIGWVRKQIADLVAQKEASEQAKEIQENLRDEIKKIQRGSEENSDNSQKLLDIQAENERLLGEIETLRRESENALKVAQRETSVVQQELDQVQEKLEKVTQEQLRRQEEIKQENGSTLEQERQKLEELKIQFNNYQEQIINKSEQDDERITELQNAIAGFENEKQRYQGIIAERDRQIKDLQNSTSSLKQSNESVEECRRLKQRLSEKEQRVEEIEKKLTQLVLRIDEQNKEISEQYNVIEVLQKKQSDNEETSGIIAELEVEKRICDQYREQCEIIKRKCDILTAANIDLQGKLNNKQDKQAGQLVQMKTLNAQLLKQNELLKDDRLAMIRDLEGLMMSKDQLSQQQVQQQQQKQQQQQLIGSPNQTNISSSSIHGMSGNHQRKPKSTTNITDEETKNSSNNKQAKIKNKIYEFNQKVFDDVDPQLFQVDQDSIEQNNDVQEENDQAYGDKLARLEEEFHQEVQSLKQIIKSKESEIVQLKVKEQIQLQQQQNSQLFQQPNSQLLTPREKKQKQNSSPSRKAVPKLEQNLNVPNNELFTSTNEYGIERRSKNHSAQLQQQQQLHNEQNLQQQIQPAEAQRRHKLSQQQQQQQQQQHQQLLLLSTAAINQSASAILERQRKSMPQMQFVTGFQHSQQQQQLSKGLSSHTNSSNAGISMNSSSNSTMNNINQNDLNINSSNINNQGSQSNKNITSSQIAQPINPTAHSSRNINEGGNSSNTNTSNSNFLDQMYLKCIERSKNLLHKNETLLKSLKSPNLKAGAAQSTTTATSILANQAQIQANQNQIHSAIQTAGIQPTNKQPAMQPQQQQQLIISPSQSVHCPDGVESFTWRQPISPQEQYFQNKQTQQQQISSSPSSLQQQQPLTVSSGQQSQLYSNSLAVPSGGKQTTQLSATSQISPIKLDYTKLLTPGQQSQQQYQQRQQQPSKQQPFQVKNNTSSSSKIINSSQQPSSSTLSQVPRYEGDLLGNLRDGAGCYFYTNGEIYEGEWKQDKRHGYGILKDEFGIDIYNGEWTYDKYDGQGRLRNQFMQIIESSSKNNISTGDYSNLDGIVRSWQFYSGEFKNNLMHGQGTLLLANNEKFIGQFENGKIQGEGSYYAQNGEVITAIWNDSRLASNTIIKSSSSPSNGSNLRY